MRITLLNPPHTAIGSRVWLHEWRDFLTRRTKPGPTVAQVIGPTALPENALARRPVA